jgi:hypothetical protein
MVTTKPVASKTVAKKTVAVDKPLSAPVVKKAVPVAAKSVKVASPVKVKKLKMVRDSFTMPKDEYEVIDSLKARSAKLGQSIKKSELLRAGIKALAGMSDIQFKAALSNVPAIKTGRPKSVK